MKEGDIYIKPNQLRSSIFIMSLIILLHSYIHPMKGWLSQFSCMFLNRTYYLGFEWSPAKKPTMEAISADSSSSSVVPLQTSAVS